jgi:hypothetical protein
VFFDSFSNFYFFDHARLFGNDRFFSAFGDGEIAFLEISRVRVRYSAVNRTAIDDNALFTQTKMFFDRFFR